MLFVQNDLYHKYGGSEHVNKANSGDLVSLYILGDLHLENNFDIPVGIEAYETIVNHFGRDSPKLNMFSSEPGQFFGEWSSIRTGLAEMYRKVGRMNDFVSILQVAADADDLDAMCMLYAWYYDLGQFDLAFKYIRRVVDVKVPVGIEDHVFAKLEKMYAEGKGVEKDLVKAEQCKYVSENWFHRKSDEYIKAMASVRS
jgi:TPR repeat protein